MNILFKKSFAFAVLIWLLLNISGIQGIYFGEGNLYTIAITKVLHLAFLWLLIYEGIRFFNSKEDYFKFKLFTSTSFFLITFILLIIIWPGAWSWDDIGIVAGAQYFTLSPWQHFLSGLFHVLCLQTLPFASGVIILQIYIAGIIVGTSVATLCELHCKNARQAWIISLSVLVISLFPPVILYVLSGFRMGLYSFLELKIFVIIYSLFLNPKRQMANHEVCILTLLVLLVANWRSEAIYYVALYLVILLLLYKSNRVRLVVGIISFCMVLTGSLSITKINNTLLDNRDYAVVSTLVLAGEVVKSANESEDISDLRAIEKILDIDMIRNNTDLRGVEYYFVTNAVKQDYNDTEYSDYIKAVIHLAVKYPKMPLETMWEFFVNSCGLDQGCHTLINYPANNANALGLQIEGSPAWQWWQLVPVPMKNVINPEARRVVLLALGGLDDEGDVSIIGKLFWNLWIPYGLFSICVIERIVNKKKLLLLPMLMFSLRIPIIFATAGNSYFMYYLSFYLLCFINTLNIIIENLNKNQL